MDRTPCGPRAAARPEYPDGDRAADRDRAALVDALGLPFDPITVDSAGAPYVIDTNHKLAREAVIPISQRQLEQIRRQQADVARRFAPEQRHFLLPRPFRWKVAHTSRTNRSASALRTGGEPTGFTHSFSAA